MDEAPLYFDAVPDRVVDKKGRNIVGKTMGNVKRHLTVVLAVTW